MKLYDVAFVAGLVSVAALAAAAAPAAAGGQSQFSLTLYDQPDYRGGSVTFYGDNANIGSTGFADRARSAQVRGTWRVCEGGGYRLRCEVLGDNVRDLAAYGFSGHVGSAQLLSGAPIAAYTPPYPAGPAAPYPAQPQAYAPQAYTPQAYAYAQPSYPPATAAAPAYAPPQDYAPPAAEAYPAYPDAGYRDRYRHRDHPYADAPYQPPGVAETPLPPVAAPAYEAPTAYPAAPDPAATDDNGIEGGTTVYFDDPRLNGYAVSAWAPHAADSFCRTEGLGSALYFDQSRSAASAVTPDGRPVGQGPILGDVLCRK